MDQLAGISLLAGLPPDERQRLAKRCIWRTFRKDQTVVESASEDRDVYFVVSGSVRIVNFALSGKPVAYANVGAGQYFGELAAIDGAPRSATVLANENCQLAALALRRQLEHRDRVAARVGDPELARSRRISLAAPPIILLSLFVLSFVRLLFHWQVIVC